MLYSVLSMLTLGVLGVAIAPWERIRRPALRVLSWGLHGGTYALLAACGTFALVPAWAPAPLRGPLAPWKARLEIVWPQLPPGTEWLILAAVLVLGAIPLLELVSFAGHLVEYHAAFRRWATQISRLGAVIRDGVAPPSPQLTPTLQAPLPHAATVLVDAPVTSLPGVGSTTPVNRSSLYELLKARR